MITVVGMDGSPLGPRAEAALAGATLVAGARRHLAAVPALAASPAGAGAAHGAPGAEPERGVPGVKPERGAPGAGAAHGAPGAEPEHGAPGAEPERGAPGVPGPRTLVLGELAPALDALASHDGDAVVLASGDPGFFGIVRALRERGLPCAVLPAVSSVAMAFARAGLPWDDAAVVSAHGRDPRPALNVCRAHPKVAVLTGPGCGPAEIGAALAGWDRRLIVCEHLGTGAERVTECSPAGAGARTWADPNVVLVLAGPESVIMVKWSLERPFHHDHEGSALPGGTTGVAHGVNVTGGAPEPGWVWPHRAAPAGWALAEELFDSRDAVITKAEVRALALARLAPAPGTLVWDVGAGSGSVAVECARFGAAVIAVERDERRCARVRANAARHAVDVRVVAGEAPAALRGLPDPDAVFVGGGGPRVIEAAAARHPARIVVALAAVERAGAAHAALAAAGYAVDGALVQAARLAPLPGGVHRLAATNPVFLLWATAGLTPGIPTAGPPAASPGARG